MYAYVTSPFAMKVQAYLLYKQMPFRVVYVNPIAPEKTLPLGRAIPVLKIGDEAKADSHAIGLWLDRRFPERSLHSGNEDVIAADLALNQTLIPMVFYSIYPQLDAALVRNIRNTLRLGHCVHKTTPGGLPWGVRYLWPLLLRNAGFIQTLTKPVKNIYGNSFGCRRPILRTFDDRLADRGFLAGTDHPTLADISAWPLLVVPYQLGLAGFDDFKAYPNIMRWVNDINPMLSSDGPGNGQDDGQLPWFVPEELDPLTV